MTFELNPGPSEVVLRRITRSVLKGKSLFRMTSLRVLSVGKLPVSRELPVGPLVLNLSPFFSVSIFLCPVFAVGSVASRGNGLLSELQILDDLFYCLYLFALGLPPALIAWKPKVPVMGLFRRPVHEKECSYYVHSQKLKYYVRLPLFSTYVNYDIIFSVHVRWDCVKNVSLFSTKKILCAKHFACLL